MKKLNGVIIDGEFYEAINDVGCDKCDFRGEFCEKAGVVLCTKLDALLSDIHIFRLNKKITQKLNGEKVVRDTNN